MPPKRKLAITTAAPAVKKKLQTTLPFAVPPSRDAPVPTETPNYDDGIVDRKYYPPVLSNARCADYASSALSKPIDELTDALSSRKLRVGPSAPGGQAVVHWFRTDLRVDDNTALSLAGELAGAGTQTLIGLYIVSPQDWDAHVVSPARVDFLLRSLEVLKTDLERKDIPLWVEVVEKRREIPETILRLCQQWGAKNVYANMEYEVDELRRDAKLVRLAENVGVAVEVVHDTCVVPPGELVTKSTGRAFAVYTPWYKACLAHLSANPSLLTMHPQPPANPPTARTMFQTLFVSSIPPAPMTKTLTPAEKATVLTLFPAGSHEALSRLTTFLLQKGRAYAEDRNIPAKPGTSMLSPYFSAGTLSARTALHHARAVNGGKLAGGQAGLDTWISEVAWRDFYKHVLVAFPYICMNKPFKPAFASIAWCAPPVADVRFAAWVEGRTGFPIVDAAMRHLAAEKYMPNRLRMVVASFLCKDLHVDWRRGERYFSEQLVDGDFASNNGGWGFASSAGVDPQPYFRVFNPKLQGEKWDPTGEYVRTWIKELKEVKGKEIHAPNDQTRKRTGYPKEIVDHDVMRKRAVEMYKEGIERGKLEV